MTPTQVAHPLRAVARTIFAGLVAFAAIFPLIITASGLDSTLPAIAAMLAVAGAITRIMAIPAVNDFIVRFLPFLAPAPADSESMGE